MSQPGSSAARYIVGPLVILLAGAGGFFIYKSMRPETPVLTEAPPSSPTPAEESAGLAKKVPDTLPDITLADVTGKPTRLASFGGRPLMVNFWATWCAPCVAEMPALDRLQKTLGGTDFEVVAISVDQGGMKPVEPFLARYQLSSLTPYLNPDASLFRAFGEKSLPVTYIIGRDGRAVGRMEGTAEWDSAAGKSLIRHYLDQPP